MRPLVLLVVVPEGPVLVAVVGPGLVGVLLDLRVLLTYSLDTLFTCDELLIPNKKVTLDTS